MEELFEKLRERRKEDWDYESGRIFSSMCSVPLSEAWRAYEFYKDTNALDTDIFPSVDVLQEETVEMLGDLFSHPGAGGFVSSGGTEGNILAFWLARKLYGGNKVIAPESVHYSVEKACDLQQLDLVLTETDDEYKANPESIKEHIDGETSAILATAGTTALGKVDPIEEIGEIADDHDCFFHVDASSGGFILPFLDNPPVWDFEVEGVSSITADPDKMGLVPIPAGAFLVREEKWLDEININAPYLEETGATLLGTRPGAPVASVWTALKSLGKEGYRHIMQGCLRMTSDLADGIREIQDLSLLTEPELNVVSFRSEKLKKSRIYRDLKDRGWLVSKNSEPESIRLVVMPHHKSKHINSFLKELNKYIEEIG